MLQHIYSQFREIVASGEPCKGDDCRGWHNSEVDTWHECSCNASKGYAHPELDCHYDYVVTSGSKVIVIVGRKDEGQDEARSCVRAGLPNVRLRCVVRTFEE